MDRLLNSCNEQLNEICPDETSFLDMNIRSIAM